MLGASLDENLLDGVDCLVHAAWDMTLTDVADAYSVNVAGSQALIRLARDAGVQRIVFILFNVGLCGNGPVLWSGKDGDRIYGERLWRCQLAPRTDLRS